MPLQYGSNTHKYRGAQWDKQRKKRTASLRAHCAEYITVGTKPDMRNCYKRNCFLVAVYDNDSSIRSRTGIMVNLAKKKGIPVICIHPDTGIVSG